MDISCIVLAGGRGLRLGRDKVLESIGNKNLIERVVSKISSFKSEIIIVTTGEQSFSQFADYPRLRIATDIYPGKGALGGLYTGLYISDSFYNLTVACDMPFLNQALLHYMVQLADGFDAVIPRLGDKVEPLHSVYSKNCLPPLERLLKQSNLKVSDVLPMVKVKYVESEEIDKFDPKHLSIFNINTASDLKKARELAKEETSDVKR